MILATQESLILASIQQKEKWLKVSLTHRKDSEPARWMMDRIEER